MNNDPHDPDFGRLFLAFRGPRRRPDGHAAFHRNSEGESLALVIAREFDLPLDEAESAIEIARKEVAL